MPRVKEFRFCSRCGEKFFPHCGNTDAKYCSIKCACRDRNTPEHQKKAGKAGSLHQIEKRGTGKGYVKEFGRHQHRIVAEKILGRRLRKGEIVHHKDGNKKNNKPSNLEVMTQSQHCKVHGFGRKTR